MEPRQHESRELDSDNDMGRVGAVLQCKMDFDSYIIGSPPVTRSLSYQLI